MGNDTEPDDLSDGLAERLRASSEWMMRKAQLERRAEHD